MNFFKKDYNKPGPGVPKNAPKKKGFARFFEVVGRDTGDLFKLNFRVALCCLPAQAFLLGAIVSLILQQTVLVFAFSVAALLASTLVVPAFTAQAYILSKRLRDDSGFAWEDFKKTFKENFRSSIILGLIYGLITASQVFMVFFTVGSGQTPSLVILIIFLFSTIIFGMLLPYLFLQKAYLELSNFSIVKNSLFLALGNAPKSFAALILHLGFSGQLIVFFSIFASPVAPELTTLLLPTWLIYSFAFGHFIPNLISLMWVWPVVDKTFSIEKTIKQRQQEKLQHIESEIAKTQSK